MPSQRGIIPGKGRVVLGLEIIPQVEETGGSIEAVATLFAETESEPIEGEAIIFWLGRDEIGTDTTNEHGRAAATTPHLRAATYSLSAQCRGISVSARYTFPKETAKVKKLAEPFPVAEGGDGVYVISFILAHEDGTPAAHEPVRLLLNRYGRKADPDKDVIDQPADGYGRFRYDLEFEERDCDVTVQVRGWQKDNIKNLRGPLGRKHVSIAKPVGGEGRGSILHAFIAGWRRQGEENRKMPS